MLAKKFFSERSLQRDSKMYLHRSDISNIREVTIGDVLRRSGPYAVLAAKKVDFQHFCLFGAHLGHIDQQDWC